LEAESSDEDTAAEENSLPDHPHLTVWPEDAGRVSGDYAAHRPESSEFNLVSRMSDCSRLCALDLVHTVEGWKLTQFDNNSAVLRDVEDGVLSRLQERITRMDVADLAARLPSCGEEVDADDVSLTSALRVKLGSSTVSCRGDRLIGDPCIIIANGKVETRVVVFAVLTPASRGGAHRRLRMLSGDARKKREWFFAYVAQDLPLGKLPSASEVIHEDLHALQTALVTGDWGFITLL